MGARVETVTLTYGSGGLSALGFLGGTEPRAIRLSDEDLSLGTPVCPGLG